MAGALVGALRVTLGIDTAAFEKGLGLAQRELTRSGKQMEKLGKQLSNVGKTMSMAITAPIVGFGAATIKTAGDFEAAMNKVGAISGATGKEFDMLRQTAMDMGRTTQFSASEAAEALSFLAMAGFDANQATAALPKTLQLAAAAQMDLASAADIVSNVLSGYGLQVAELGSVNDVLVKTMTSANTDLRQLGEAMKYAGPLANAAGVNFEEAAAAIGLMGNAGIQGSMAGTSLRGALTQILNPSKKAAAAMAAAGLSFTDAEGRVLPLVDIIRQLEPVADDAGLFMTLFGQRAGPSMAALVSQGADALADLTGELENAGGTAARISEAQMEGFNGAVKRLKSAMEGLMIVIGNSGLLDFFAGIANSLAAFASRMAETSPGVLKFVTILAALAAAIGPLVWVAGSMIGALGSLKLVIVPLLGLFGKAGLAGALATAAGAITPFLAPIAAVAAVGALIYANWDKIAPVLENLRKKFVETLGPKLQSLIETVKTTLTGLWNGPFGQAIRVVIDVLGQFAAAYIAVLGEGLIRIISALVSYVEAGFKIIGDVFNIVIGLLTGDFSRAWEGLKSLVGNVITGVVNILKSLAPETVKVIVEMASAFATRLGQLASDMITMGRNIIDGLVKGILAAPEAVWNALKSVVMRGVDNIKSFLGIASPSRLFMTLGGFITDGLAIGITDGTPKVQEAMAKLGTTVADGMAGMSAGQGISLNPSIDVGAQAGTDLRNTFRTTFADGIKAALDGNLKGFFQKWFEGNGTRAFENILNTVADQFSNMISGLFGNTGAGRGGGLGGFLGNLFKGIFGGAPGFALGGSFTVGGRPGRDANLVAFRATRGEHVQISSGETAGTARDGLGVVNLNFYGPVSNPQEVRRSAAQAGAHFLRLAAAGKRGS